MSKHKHKIDEDELPVIALDRERRAAEYPGFETKGWKFYIKIKPQLMDWWREFNGELKADRTKGVRNKYKTVYHFAKEKIKDHTERNWLIWMIGPKKVWERDAINHKRYIVPWLGDWQARRRNGYWETENREQIKYLKNAIKDNLEASKAIRATSPFVVQTLMRWVRLQEKIDKLFDGEPFGDEVPSKQALARFKLYTSMHQQVEELKENTYKTWMMIQGVDPKSPHEMWDMTTVAQAIGQSAAAGALTGYTAGSMQPVLDQDGKPNGHQQLNLNNQGIVISPDALLLAQHLVKHSQTFKRPLPAIEGEIVQEEKKEKANGHSKAN